MFQSFWSKQSNHFYWVTIAPWIMNKSKNKIDIKIAASRRPVSFATSAAKSFSESPPWQALVSSSLLKLQYLSPSCADVCSMVSYGVIRLFSTYYSFYFFLVDPTFLILDATAFWAQRNVSTGGPVLPALPATTATGSRTLEDRQRCEWQQYFAVFTNSSQAVTGIQSLDTCQVFGNSHVNH